MGFGGAFVYSIVTVVNLIIDILTFLIVLRAIISWFSPNPYNQLVQFLINVTEPILRPLRRALPRFGNIDISPLVAIIVLVFIRTLIMKMLAS